MKTLTKQNLEAMVDKLPVLTEEEQRSVIGGCNCTPDAEYCPNSGACFDSGQWIAGQGWINNNFGDITGVCCEPEASTGSFITGSSMTVTGGIFIVEADGSFSYVGESDKLIIAVGSVDSGDIFYYNQGVSVTMDGNRTYLEGDNIDKGLFETLSNKTTVEWGLATNSQNNDFVLTTSHKEHSVDPVLPIGNGWDTFYHNHSAHSQAGSEPSGRDLKRTIRDQEKGYKDYYIYYEKNGEYYYY